MLSSTTRSCLALTLALVVQIGFAPLEAQIRGEPVLLEVQPGLKVLETEPPFTVGDRALYLGPPASQGLGRVAVTVTDGTPEGTVPLEFPGNRQVDGGYGSPVSLISPNFAMLQVRVGPPEQGPRVPMPRELWITDGTQDGTVLVREIGDTTPFHLTYSESLGAFLRGEPRPDGGVDVVLGPEPTGPATPLGVFDTFPREVLQLESYTVLESGRGFWFSDGTMAGTSFVGVVSPVKELQRPFAALGNQAYYFAQEPGDAYALWKTSFDGRPSERVVEIPGDPRWLFTIGQRSFFSLYSRREDVDAAFHLWSVELESGKMEYLSPIDSGVYPFPIGDRLLDFRRFAEPGEPSLVAHTSEGTVEVLADCCRAEQILGRNRFEDREAREREFFRLDHPAYGREWWVTDGTRVGTQLLVDACPGPCDGNLWLESTERVGPHLVFTGRREVGDGPRQVFLFNEATRHLEQVTDFQSTAPGNEGGVRHLRIGGHMLYLTARDDAHGLEPWAIDATPVASCAPSAAVLCLDEDRFAVTAKWSDFSGGSGEGVTRPLTSDTGSFWFFDQENLELIVKVLDGTALNDRHWVFYGSLSNVEFELEVADTLTGERATYRNPSGRFASVGDTEALPSSPFATSQARPVANETAKSSCASPADLCLGDRFSVSVAWRDFAGNTGTGRPVTLTRDTGAFWFFDRDNLELVLKVLDGTSVNGHFWVFYGALSNVEFEITVTDELGGEVVTYENPSGTFASVGDAEAFPVQP